MKKAAGRKFKSYCEHLCTNCNSINFISKAQRWCYDEKFDLKVDHGERYRDGAGKVNRVLTNIIEHETFGKDSIGQSCTWEMNFIKIV